MTLELESVVVAYGGSSVLEGMSLTLAAGEALALVGPNGSGKSTLLGSVAGLVPIVSGDIRLGGRSLVGEPPEARCCLGISSSLQGQRVFSRLTVAENLAASLHAVSAADARRAVGEILARFPTLGGLRSRRAASLNGGARQVLSVAMALSRARLGLRLALVDEPTLGLDEESLVHVVDHLREALGAGVSLIAAEHDPRFLALTGWERLPLGHSPPSIGEDHEPPG